MAICAEESQILPAGRLSAADCISAMGLGKAYPLSENLPERLTPADDFVIGQQFLNCSLVYWQTWPD
ncbi:hypothetical protein XH91_32840 [Bradyrhizobium guangzhouense]|uniref:Uncharacterized protein n=1 Tax=Bradyrhizobium guangzhouense TaxID=1325095 RepID=A0AAE5X6U3_9BRAD|nr:hypothetical protein XH91_32840 [Bradyrhizobium guangzhouense]